MPLTLQFCSFDSLAGSIIDWGTQSDIGHVDLVLPDGSLLGAQYEDGLGDMPSGVQIRPANYGDSCGMTNRWRIELPTDRYEDNIAYQWAMSMVGCPYDTGNLLGIIRGENDATPGSFICSGFIAGVLCQPAPSIIKHKLHRPWRTFTPDQLFQLCNGFAEAVPFNK